jgi:hypothetical protein
MAAVLLPATQCVCVALSACLLQVLLLLLLLLALLLLLELVPPVSTAPDGC